MCAAAECQLPLDDDPFLSKINPQWLQVGGFLDLLQPFQDTLHGELHPLFRITQFEGLSPDDYQLLLPSIRLASTTLAQPVFMPFWHALIFSERRVIRNFQLTCRYGRYCYRFDLAEGGITRQESVRAWEAILQLCSCVRFMFAPLSRQDGVTLRCESRPGLPGFEGCGSTIVLSQYYLYVLREFKLREGQITANDTESPFAIPYLNESSIVRTRFHLAKTMLHELAHAIKWATTPLQPTNILFNQPHPLEPPLEPFFGDQRLAEVGRAYESVVFKGLTFPFGTPSHPSARFGLGVEKWPDLWDAADPLRGPSRLLFSTTYAVPMAWVAGLWTSSHWADVAQYGIEANWCPRILGVREYRKEPWGTDDDEEELLSQDGEDSDEDGENSDEDGEDSDENGAHLDESKGKEQGGDGTISDFETRERLHRIKVNRWMTIKPDHEAAPELDADDSAGDDSSQDRPDCDGVIRIDWAEVHRKNDEELGEKAGAQPAANEIGSGKKRARDEDDEESINVKMIKLEEWPADWLRTYRPY